MTTHLLLHVAALYGFAALVVSWPVLRQQRGGWRLVALAVIAGVVLLNLRASLLKVLEANDTDWRVLAEAGRRAGTAALYVPWDTGPFRYSPLYAWLLVPLGWLGHGGFAALHVAVLPLFRNWRVIALLLVSWPFWFDAINGNVLVFVLLAAWWAVRGNQAATFVYLGLVLLMPRPLMVPVATWLLWQRPEWRLRFAGMVAISIGLVVWTGLGDEWLPALLANSGTMLDHPWNFGPSQPLGVVWVPISVALSAWLIYRSHLGLASLAMSPYLIPYYWLFVLLELRPRDQIVRSDEDHVATVRGLPARAYSTLRRLRTPRSRPFSAESVTDP